MRRNMNQRVERTPERALEILKWMSSRMERCRSDAISSLYRWHVDPAQHEAIIDKLIEEKYIDETRYTRTFISEKLNNKQWGVAKIKYTLKLKRIDEQLINDTLAEMVDKEEMADNLYEQLERRAKKELIPGMDRYKAREKLFRWAAYRGFAVEDIHRALRKIMNLDDY